MVQEAVIAGIFIPGNGIILIQELMVKEPKEVRDLIMRVEGEEVQEVREKHHMMEILEALAAQAIHGLMV